MPRRGKIDILGVTGAETIIGPGVTVKGNLSGTGDIMIDGQLTGDVTTSADLTIGVNGHVKANLKGINITIAGAIDGNIVAEGDVTIRETGRVTGDITSASLAIVPGGLFSGRSAIREHHELGPAPEDDEA